MKTAWLLVLMGGVMLSGCGSPEATDSAVSTQSYTSTNLYHPYYFKALNPTYLAFDRASAAAPNTLVPVNRQLPVNEFQMLAEPSLSPDGTLATQVITGIGISATDLNNNRHINNGQPQPLKITLGIVARQYNYQTGTFGTQTRTFSAPGVTFEKAQLFVIQNADNPNFLLTGLGLRLSGGNITTLNLQTSTLPNIMNASDQPTGMASVVVDPGWAAIGFLIRIDPNLPKQVPGQKAVDPRKIPYPFVEDAIIYTGEITNQ